MQTREEHLAWCKERALAYCDRGDVTNAMNSMLSDMGKHEGTRDHPANKMIFELYVIGEIRTAEEMRSFIEGFN